MRAIHRLLRVVTLLPTHCLSSARLAVVISFFTLSFRESEDSVETAYAENMQAEEDVCAAGMGRAQWSFAEV